MFLFKKKKVLRKSKYIIHNYLSNSPRLPLLGILKLLLTPSWDFSTSLVLVTSLSLLPLPFRLLIVPLFVLSRFIFFVYLTLASDLGGRTSQVRKRLSPDGF